MNLDDPQAYAEHDPGRLIDWIDRMPQMCLDAWEAARQAALPDLSGVRQVVIAAMGNSALAASLARALAAPEARVPVEVVRDYALPAYARGRETLVIAASYAGDTHETLAAFAQARERGARLLAVTAGGRLTARALEYGAPVVPLPPGAPHSRVMSAYGFVLLAGLFARMGLLADLRADLLAAADSLRARQAELRVASPAVHNAAKRLAGQLVERIPVVYGAGVLAPVAQCWKALLNENAKSWSEFDVLPELNHNAVTGIVFPQMLMTKVAVIVLTSSLYPAAIQKRCDLTRALLMEQGILVDAVKARGESNLAHMLTTLHFGLYSSYYLAIAYGIEPAPVPPVAWLREQMGD